MFGEYQAIYDQLSLPEQNNLMDLCRHTADGIDAVLDWLDGSRRVLLIAWLLGELRTDLDIEVMGLKPGGEGSGSGGMGATA